jgi:hypothetical protein
VRVIECYAKGAEYVPSDDPVDLHPIPSGHRMIDDGDYR